MTTLQTQTSVSQNFYFTEKLVLQFLISRGNPINVNFYRPENAESRESDPITQKYIFITKGTGLLYKRSLTSRKKT